MSYGKSIGSVIGATLVFGAVSKLVPKKNTLKGTRYNSKKRKGGRKKWNLVKSGLKKDTQK